MEMYWGTSINSVMHGIGIYIDRKNVRYEGCFSQNKLHGFGTCKWSKEKFYIGDWRNGLREGYGHY